MFSYHRDVIEQYRTIQAVIIHATDLTNGPSPPGLLDHYEAEQHAVLRGLKTTPIAELPPIAAWRRAFTRFGAKPTQHRNAAEALLRRLDRHGDIPSINTVVDIGNLVSIRHTLPVAVFDLANIAGGSITVRLATGAETFTDLGSVDSVAPEPGEVIFVDRHDIVVARRWCWRQSAHSATRTATTDALIVIEGHHSTARDDVSHAATDYASLLAKFQPASRITTHRLSATNPATTVA